MSNPASRGRVAAAAAGIALAAAAAGIGSLDVHGRGSQSSSTPITTVQASPSSTLSTGSPPGSVAAPAALVFPDPTLHPGAINTNLDMTQLCAAGFSTKTIRPPVAYTDRLKALELGAGGTIIAPSGTTYNVVGEQLPGVISDYELDHLISLEIGGNPEDPKNLWMEPWERKGAHLAAAGQGAESKDVVENRLHREICAGTLTLADAQTEIATNWATAK